MSLSGSYQQIAPPCRQQHPLQIYNNFPSSILALCPVLTPLLSTLYDKIHRSIGKTFSEILLSIQMLMIPGIIQLDLKIDYRTECRIPISYAFQHNVHACCCSRDSAGVMPYVYEHVQWSHV